MGNLSHLTMCLVTRLMFLKSVIRNMYSLLSTTCTDNHVTPSLTNSQKYLNEGADPLKEVVFFWKPHNIRGFPVWVA
jgi:hypothetical protein